MLRLRTNRAVCLRTFRISSCIITLIVTYVSLSPRIGDVCEHKCTWYKQQSGQCVQNSTENADCPSKCSNTGIPNEYKSLQSDIHAVQRVGVYPHLQGGLGNQLFILSTAALIAKHIGGNVIVNSKQTRASSYGVPQPVFWHTMFDADVFVKESDYDEGFARGMNETQFRAAMANNFTKWKNLSHGVYTDGAFLNFSYPFQNRQFLMQIYSPLGEVQRWVNDYAVRLGLALPGKESSLSASYFNEKYANHDLATAGTGPRKSAIKDEVPRNAWSCGLPLRLCERPIQILSCSSADCEKNVAVHVRLQDRSTFADYWDEGHLIKVIDYIMRTIEQGNRVIAFSNDPLRSEILFKKHLNASSLLTKSLQFSSSIDVVEFWLMSQYFGTHILTGSTYQLWSLFLTPLRRVKVILLEDTDTVGFVECAKHHQPELYTFEEI
mmetsp:Transcript_3881/g.14984  ORF Transcript_3881/g.14984 Transcript_3881/m.14984 type:complete len:437 (+) Transcript_3881:121-1431(+)